MDRSFAMLVIFCCLVSVILLLLAVFAQAPIVCSCILSLFYTMYHFLSDESQTVHHAQEYENRFWTGFAMLCSTALFFAKDSPLNFIGLWNPSLGFLSVLCSGYGMHIWDRHMHRQHLSMSGMIYSTLRRTNTATTNSWNSLTVMQQGIPLKDLLEKVNGLLRDIDQILIPSTVNNFINMRFILNREREIISIFEEAEPRALNYLIGHAKLGLLFYKIKDHRKFNQRHRTQLIELLASERISHLTVHSRVIVLHSLQMMKLPANAKAEHWVKKIILSTKQDELSDLKTQADGKGNWYCMSKLIYDDIRSDMVRQDILKHIQREANVQNAHMKMNTKRSKLRKRMAWRKILSDVDDTLTCSGGSYPAGIDKRYGKKVVYPGVLAFYRELDLGTNGPEEWPSNTVGNLVFLSARPHFYKDISEKHTFEKFKKLQERAGRDGRGGMHTVPSLLSGDLKSGTEFMVMNDFEPLAQKKFENFKKYVSIYPEFRHVFVCDNGQGDVRAAELMVDAFPKQMEAIYVQVVQSITKTYKYDAEKWSKMCIRPFFFKSYPEAALDAIRRDPPLIGLNGLRRICQDAINDFYLIKSKDWPSQDHKWDRREEVNQSLWSCNQYLESRDEETVPLLEAERLWKSGQNVSTPYGNGTIKSFDAVYDMYIVELDWRPLSSQVTDHEEQKSRDEEEMNKAKTPSGAIDIDVRPPTLETVFEAIEEVEDEASSALISDMIDDSIRSITISDTQINNSNVSSQLSSEEISEHQKKMEKNETNHLDSSPSNLIIQSNEVTVESKITADNEVKYQDGYHPVFAKIQGRLIRKFTPPTLPQFPKEDEDNVRFSFWSSKSDVKPKPLFNKGDQCSTPFGPGVVVEYREEDKIVVVDMSNWSAKAYLNKDAIKLGGTGFFGSLFRIIKTTENSDKSPQQKQQVKKEVEFPYAIDSTLQTPFGPGRVFRPVDKNKTETKTTSHDTAIYNDSKDSSNTLNEIIGISLTSWHLADESHPKLYCTVYSALQWKEEENKSKSGGLLSVVGSFVSQSVKLLTRNSEKKVEVPSEILVPRFEQYYMDGASVTTPFGQGIVRCFRDNDGMYEVVLTNWKMMGGKSPTIYLMKEALSHYIRSGCHEGYPVLTGLGVTGNLASVQPRTGIHIVTVPSAGMVCYLQPQDVLRPLKAAEGEDVLTPYGEGKVVKYRIKDDMYEIDLAGAKLYAKAEAFDRANDSLEDQRDSGMKWLLGFLFFGDRSVKDSGSQRSRSNSITSLSVRSQSSRSVK